MLNCTNEVKVYQIERFFFIIVYLNRMLFISYNQFACIGHLLGNNMKSGRGTRIRSFLYLMSLPYSHGYFKFQKLRSRCIIITIAVYMACLGVAMKRMFDSVWGLGRK